MKHLTEMCCAQCIEKLQAIEQRACSTPGFDVGQVAQAFADRIELLAMIEKLLMGVAINRENWERMGELLPKMLPPAPVP